MKWDIQATRRGIGKLDVPKMFRFEESRSFNYHEFLTVPPFFFLSILFPLFPWGMRAVNDSWYVSWAHFPPEKHKIAYKIIEGVNIIDVYSRFVASAFPGKFSFVFRRVRPIMVFFFFFAPPLFWARQRLPSWENFLSSPPGWEIVESSKQ